MRTDGDGETERETGEDGSAGDGSAKATQQRVDHNLSVLQY